MDCVFRNKGESQHKSLTEGEAALLHLPRSLIVYGMDDVAGTGKRKSRRSTQANDRAAPQFAKLISIGLYAPATTHRIQGHNSNTIRMYE